MGPGISALQLGTDHNRRFDASRQAKDLKEAQGVIDSLKEALVASEKRADQQAQQFEQREQHWQNEFAHAAAKAESLTDAAAQEKAQRAKTVECVRLQSAFLHVGSLLVGEGTTVRGSF